MATTILTAIAIPEPTLQNPLAAEGHTARWILLKRHSQ